MIFQTAGLDPAGALPGFAILRALAVGGQVVRVVFSHEPIRQSAAGNSDALNPSNYSVSLASGSGAPVQTVGVMATGSAYPAYGVVAPDEYGVDVQVDRALVVGMSYEVAVNRSVISARGETLAFPSSAQFVGAARPARTRQLRRKVGLVDLASDPFKGGIVVKGGDWTRHEGVESTAKRIWRIVFTARGRFVWLPNFGLKFDIKKPATLAILGGLRTDLRQQLQRQPDIGSAESSVAMDGRGFLTLTIRAKTTSGQEAGGTVTASSDRIP